MITVYLDSQDYSILTDPKQLTPALIGLRERLKEYARSGQVRFVFSGFLVAEATPIDANVASLAVPKADLLSELCGRNAMVPIEKLLTMEIKALSGARALAPNPFDSKGNWFSDFAPIEGGGLWQEMKLRMDCDLRDRGLNRQKRRSQVRKLIKNGQPRTALRTQVDQQDTASLMRPFFESYRMSPEYEAVMLRYCKGLATDAELNEAVRGSMRDPKYMMRWFATSQALANPISEYVRKPGREMGSGLRRLATVTKDYAEFLLNQDLPTPLTVLAKEWGVRQGSQMCGFVRAFAESKSLTVPASFDATDVVAKCPGVATMFGALYSRVWENVAGGKKTEVSDSLTVDAMHALYAPYVDVFRADREMAPHIAKQLKLHRTVIVPKRETLPTEIDRLLQSQ